MDRSTVVGRTVIVCASLGFLAGAPLLGQAVQRVSVNSDEVQSAASSSTGSYITPDGRYVVFATGAVLAPGDTNGLTDIYIRDLVTGTTARVSVPDPGVTGSPTNANAACTLSRAGVRYCSDNGRHVVFQSTASNLVNNDTNADDDVNGIDCFVRDRDVDGNGIYDEPGVGKTRTVRVSVSSNEAQWIKFSIGLDTYSGGCQNPSISANGEMVAFDCQGDPFSGAGEHGTTGRNVYARNRDNDNDNILDEAGSQGATNQAITILVSKLRCSCTGDQFDGISRDPAISGDGRFVAFVTASEYLDYDLVFDNDNNDRDDVYVRDLSTSSESMRISVDSSEADNNGNCVNPSISHDGRHIAFTTSASLLIPRSGDSNGTTDVYVRDRGVKVAGDYIFVSGNTVRASHAVFANLFNGTINRFNQLTESVETPFISPDGRHVAFVTAQDGVICGILGCTDANDKKDVYVRDLTPGSEWTYIASRTSQLGDSNGDSTFPSIINGGAVVAYASIASNIVSPDANGVSSDVYVNSQAIGTTPIIASVVSRKTHGPGGDFDINLNLTGAVLNVEPRAGGPTQLIFTFSEPVSYTGNGPVYVASSLIADSFQIAGNDVIFNVHGAPDESCGWFQIGNFVGSSGNPVSGQKTVYYRALQGDNSGGTVVNSGDVDNAKIVSGQSVLNTNFRSDFNLDGEVDAADILRVKARDGHSAPSCQ